MPSPLTPHLVCYGYFRSLLLLLLLLNPSLGLQQLILYLGPSCRDLCLKFLSFLIDFYMSTLFLTLNTFLNFSIRY